MYVSLSDLLWGLPSSVLESSFAFIVFIGWMWVCQQINAFTRVGAKSVC